MPEPKAGPIFKIGTHYLRTKIEADGTHVVNPVDMRAVWPEPGTGPKLSDPEVQKLMLWMRSGKSEQPSLIDVRKIPFAIADRVVVAPRAVLHGNAPSGAYCRLFDVLSAFGLASEDGELYVNSGSLRLSAEKMPCQLSEMLVLDADLIDFAQTTGLQPETGVRH